MLALGCEVEVVVLGSYARLLRAAGGAWQRERVRPSGAFKFLFFYNCHRGLFEYFMKTSEKHTSVGYDR